MNIEEMANELAEPLHEATQARSAWRTKTPPGSAKNAVGISLKIMGHEIRTVNLPGTWMTGVKRFSGAVSPDLYFC